MTTERKILAAFICLALATALPTPPVNAQDDEQSPSPILLIFDASGSMWGQIQGENKIVIARNVLAELINGLPSGQEVGLIAYGHRREGDCDDIETLQGIEVLDPSAFISTVNGLNPKGKTPITKSVQQAFDLLDQTGSQATVILVSDGLETCGGDPCAAVRLAKDRGLEFVMHVVGFDVAGEDTSSLQCAAQAGNGMFLSAENAQELSGALERAVEMSADVPAGRLAVTGIRNGELHDISVLVTDQNGEMVAGGRTYTTPSTNPSSIPLPDGVFDVRIQATGMKGEIVRTFQIEIKDGNTVERTEDFSTGQVSIGVTRNAAPSDAVYKVYSAGTRDQTASGRTYTGPTQNPAQVTLTVGEYDVEVRSVEIEGETGVKLGRITIEPSGLVELSHDFPSGELRVKVHRSGQLVDSVVSVSDGEGNSVGGSRTYTSEASNPTEFTVLPGSYRLSIREIRGARTERTATVEVGATTDVSVDLDQL